MLVRIIFILRTEKLGYPKEVLSVSSSWSHLRSVDYWTGTTTLTTIMAITPTITLTTTMTITPTITPTTLTTNSNNTNNNTNYKHQ